MLSSSLFNNAVPKFTNGNYANNPIDPSYIEEIGMEDYNRGVEPLDTLPAQWWNWLCNQFTSRFNKLNTYVKNIFDEITQLLSLLNVTPDGTESAITTGQLKNFFKELYPSYVSDKLELGTTYVHQTTRVNGHALSADVTVTKSDVGLGDVVNTGDSATPVENGTTKFTTGGAYTELNKKADLLDIASTFSTSTSYSVGDYVIYNGDLYRCVTAHSGSWTASHFTQVTVGDELSLKADKTSLAVPSDSVLHYSFDDIPDIPDGTATERYLNGNTYDVAFNGNGTITTDAYVEGDDLIHRSSVNGNENFKSDLSTSLSRGVYKDFISYAGKIVVIEIYAKTDNILPYIREQETSESEIVNNYIFGREPLEQGKHKFIFYIPNYYRYTITMYGRNRTNYSYSEWELLNFYIGDGSYVTPIIDNVNGENNATNNGGIAVQGVSGKGAYFPSSLQLVTINELPAVTSNDSFSISLWLNISELYVPDENTSKAIFAIGNLTHLIGLCRQGYNVLFVARADSSSTSTSERVSMDLGNWHCYTMVYDGQIHNFNYYKDGVKQVKTNSNSNPAGYQFGTSSDKWTIWGDYVRQGTSATSTQQPAEMDDVLFYDRALTDSEVMTLYLNKANTPKYYTLNDYELNTGLDDVETRLDDVETELSGIETESVGTLRKFCGDIPSNCLDCSKIQRRRFGKLQEYNTEHGKMFQLKDGSIYMCSTRQGALLSGLLKYNGANFETVKYTYNITYNYPITHLLQALDGTIYAVAGTKIFTTTDMVNFTNVNVTGLPDVTDSLYINTFVQTADGAFYVGIATAQSSSGLYRSTNGTSYSLISSNITYCVLQATSGTYYAGTSGGLYKSTNGTSFSVMVIAGIGTVDCIYQTKNGDIYAGSAASDGKLYKSTDGTTFSAVSSVPSYGISGIVQEDDGSIYVATGNFVSGNTNNVSILVSTDGTNFTSIATYTNTSSEEVYPMLKAKDGSIFLNSVAFGIVKSTKWGVVSKTNYPTLYSVVGDRYADNVVSLESTDFVIPLEEDSSFNCGIQI